MADPRGDQRLYMHLKDDPPPSPENIRQQILEAENRELRQQVKYLRSAVRSVASIVRPYVPASPKR
jgi:hypothetical protein